MTLESAVRALQAKDWGQAASICLSLIQAGQQSADAFHLLGIALSESGRTLEALEAIRQSVTLQPDNAVFQASLGLTLKRLGELDQAAAAYAQALSRIPTQTQWLYQSGLVNAELGRVDEAEQAFKRALAQQPRLFDAMAALARLYEAQGRWVQAAEAVDNTLKGDPQNTSARITRADLLLRQQDPQAVLLLRDIAEDQSLAQADRAIAYAKLGRHWDKAGELDSAWQAFVAGNTLLADQKPKLAPSVYGRQQIELLQERLGKARWQTWTPTPGADSPAPVFLVGFPRSGTTLLERMLAMHPKVSQLDEKDTLRDALSLVGGTPEQRALERWDNATLERLRASYWRNVEHFLGRPPHDNEVVVDKLPLNSLHLELIHRLFPQARILFALRDPRDVCLSCFMQSFGLNDAMANFLTMASTVAYYVKAMTLAVDLKAALPLKRLDIRYEELILDPETHLRAILRFLDLPWTSEVLRFHQTESNEVINTPSYQQVRQPLYETSVGRWDRYRKHLGNALEPLTPLVCKLGYGPVSDQ